MSQIYNNLKVTVTLAGTANKTVFLENDLSHSPDGDSVETQWVNVCIYLKKHTYFIHFSIKSSNNPPERGQTIYQRFIVESQSCSRRKGERNHAQSSQL